MCRYETSLSIQWPKRLPGRIVDSSLHQYPITTEYAVKGNDSLAAVSVCKQENPVTGFCGRGMLYGVRKVPAACSARAPNFRTGRNLFRVDACSPESERGTPYSVRVQ